MGESPEAKQERAFHAGRLKTPFAAEMSSPGLPRKSRVKRRCRELNRPCVALWVSQCKSRECHRWVTTFSDQVPRTLKRRREYLGRNESKEFRTNHIVKSCALKACTNRRYWVLRRGVLHQSPTLDLGYQGAHSPICWVLKVNEFSCCLRRKRHTCQSVSLEMCCLVVM